MCTCRAADVMVLGSGGVEYWRGVGVPGCEEPFTRKTHFQAGQRGHLAEGEGGVGVPGCEEPVTRKTHFQAGQRGHLAEGEDDGAAARGVLARYHLWGGGKGVQRVRMRGEVGGVEGGVLARYHLLLVDLWERESGKRGERERGGR